MDARAAYPEGDVLDYHDASAVLGIKVGTLYALVSQKRIPHIRIGRRLIRFRRSDLEAWLAKHAISPEASTDGGGRRRPRRPPHRPAGGEGERS